MLEKSNKTGPLANRQKVLLTIGFPIFSDFQQPEKHIYAMYPKLTESIFLFKLPAFTNPMINHMSRAKPRRESNPKLVQRAFPSVRCAVSDRFTEKSQTPSNSANNGLYKPTLCEKKGSAGAGYIT